MFVESDEHLMTVFRYVARNPVEAGLCALPEDWPWSSCRAALGLPGGRFSFADPSLVLDLFDGSAERLRVFVETPWESDKNSGSAW